MRILLDYRPALRQRTGVGAYVHETACALAASAPEDEALVLFSSSWKDRLLDRVVAGARQVDRRVPVALLNLAWHRLGWPPVEWLAGPQLDVVHATHPLLIPSRRAARLVTIYDLDFLDHPERTQGEIRRDYPALAGSHARRADQVVVISRHTASEVETRLGVAPSHISVCVPGAPPWSRRTHEPERDACLLFLGTLAPRKNLDVLLDAYARVLGFAPETPPLVLAGRVTSAADAIVRRIKEPPLAGHVELPGYIDDLQKRTLFNRALALVMPSHTEGFGLPAVEAMTVGVPVVAANRGALPESVGSAGLLVDPDNAEALAAALQTLLRDSTVRQRLADEGWHRSQQFSWARTAATVREAWRLALEHRAQRHG